ncbi:MAG: hypothetical protein QXP81_04565 [Nitrososphaerota archaeon]
MKQLEIRAMTSTKTTIEDRPLNVFTYPDTTRVDIELFIKM